MENKTCSKCLNSMPLTEFYKKGKYVKHICKSCENQQRKEQRIENKELRLINNKKKSEKTKLINSEIEKIKKVEISKGYYIIFEYKIELDMYLLISKRVLEVFGNHRLEISESVLKLIIINKN